MKAKLKPIHDQVAVLIGATSGIGLETALYMAEKGAKVVIVGRSQEGLDDALERVRSHAQSSRMMRGRGNGMQQEMMSASQGEMQGTASTIAALEDQVTALEADMTDFEQLRGVAEQVVQRFGRIDTWVNVAAVSEWALFEDTSPEEFRRIIDVNLIGQAYGAMAVLPYMKQQEGGSIIFVSSIAGRIPIPYQTAYNASKHGLLGMVETLRLEVKHTRIPINITAILPASMNTPLFNKARTKLGVEPNPIPPIYDTRMVARAITYAAQHPVRELIVGDSGYAINFMRRLAPTLTSNMMGASGFRMQRSNEPKSAQAPDNLYHHVAGYNQVEGEFSHRTMQFSPLTWLSTHPKARLALYALLAGGAALFIGSKFNAGNKRTFRHRISRQAESLGRRTGAVIASLPLISSLPMFKKKSFIDRFTDRVPAAYRKIKSARMMDRLPDQVPFVHRQKPLAQRLPLYDQRKALSEKLPTAHDLKTGVEKVVHKAPFVERRETIADKIPFIKS